MLKDKVRCAAIQRTLEKLACLYNICRAGGWDHFHYLSYKNVVIQNTVEYKDYKSTMSFRCSEATKQHYLICLFKYEGCTWKGCNCVSKADFFLIRGGFHLNFRPQPMKHVHSCTRSTLKENPYLNWHFNKEGKCLLFNPFHCST